MECPKTAVSAGFCVFRCSDGRICQSPNSSDETTVARVRLHTRSRSASSTPRNATSSSSTVPIGTRISTRSATCRPVSPFCRWSENSSRVNGSSAPTR